MRTLPRNQLPITAPLGNNQGSVPIKKEREGPNDRIEPCEVLPVVTEAQERHTHTHPQTTPPHSLKQTPRCYLMPGR